MRPAGLLLLGSFLIAMSQGCATPAPLVRLKPSVGEVVWVSGRATVTKTDAGIRVGVAFDHQDGPALGLRVEVANGTETNLDVDPHEFTFTTCRSLEPTSCSLTTRVIDPERVLFALDETQSRERAKTINGQAVLGTLVILNAVGNVATIAGGRADRNTVAGTVAAGSMMQTAAIAGETRRLSLTHQQAIWSNEALRRNTLFPGSGTGGRIYVPIDLDAGVVWLHVRTGGRVFSFPFQQTVTQLAEPRTRHLERGGGF